MSLTRTLSAGGLALTLSLASLGSALAEEAKTEAPTKAKGNQAAKGGEKKCGAMDAKGGDKSCGEKDAKGGEKSCGAQKAASSKKGTEKSCGNGSCS